MGFVGVMTVEDREWNNTEQDGLELDLVLMDAMVITAVEAPTKLFLMVVLTLTMLEVWVEPVVLSAILDSS